ncbi:MAG: hypothetical protein LBT76_02275 [Tannerella sp.]|jgi:hypothetical protein|nr:hypothetical protein [Tannerella sp.]
MNCLKNSPKVNIEHLALCFVIFAGMCSCRQPSRSTSADWLIDNSAYRSDVSLSADGKELTVSNGLAARKFRTLPNLATVGLYQLTTGQNHIRAVRPEGNLVIDGVPYNIGGLSGQPVQNYLLPSWIDRLSADPNSFQYTGYETQKIRKRFEWKKHPEWMSQEAVWPPAGVELTLHFEAPAAARVKGLSVDVHYEMYDGIPLMCKWIELENRSGRTVVLNRFVSEILAAVEGSTDVTIQEGWSLPDMHVETDYAFANSVYNGEKEHTVHWVRDTTYTTQINYMLNTPCLLEVRPPEGPEQAVPDGQSFATFRTWELLYDSDVKERRSLSKRKMYRTVAPWAMENPVIMHVRNADEQSVKLAVDQCAETGFEMVIMTFGSGFDMESGDPAYYARMKQLADYAHGKRVALGGYSLLASRAVDEATDVINPLTGKRGGFARFGDSPCLGSEWGEEYFRKITELYRSSGMDMIEHDGSYPGDFCASVHHPGHKSWLDSQWNQWRIISDFYRWCRSQGIYLNVPDWYFLNGSSKAPMGYRETNWSLPREQQEIIERQNVYDGTRDFTPSMGWMFVPLTEYHGGGAAATIEPLSEHLAHYSQRLANLFGAGVQACYRGPRLYDTDSTKAVVKRWVDFYKKYRPILDSDVIHLRRPDGQDWDGLLHVNPSLPQKGFLMVYNPLDVPVEKDIRLPLYYTGLAARAVVREQDLASKTFQLDRDYTIRLNIKIPAKGYNWYVIE